MVQQLTRMKSPAEIETLWVDYVLELAAEARADPAREATTAVTHSLERPTGRRRCDGSSCASRRMTPSG
jgi:hypothetical protein